MSAQRPDYYAILEIEADASPLDIKKAFRRLALAYHPDVNGQAEAEAKFKQINEAYEILSNPEERAAYDRSSGRGWQVLRTERRRAAAQDGVKIRSDIHIKLQVHQSTLELRVDNIIRQDTSAIVNEVNVNFKRLFGLNAAVQRAAGVKLKFAFEAIGPLEVGQAKITPGFNLTANWIIHAAGPYFLGREADGQLLAATYLACLKLASQYSISSLTFPALSTGSNNYPIVPAAEVGLRTVTNYLQAHPEIELVRFVLINQETYRIFERILGDFTSRLG